MKKSILLYLTPIIFTSCLSIKPKADKEIMNHNEVKTYRNAKFRKEENIIGSSVKFIGSGTGAYFGYNSNIVTFNKTNNNIDQVLGAGLGFGVAFSITGLINEKMGDYKSTYVNSDADHKRWLAMYGKENKIADFDNFGNFSLIHEDKKNKYTISSYGDFKYYLTAFGSTPQLDLFLIKDVNRLSYDDIYLIKKEQSFVPNVNVDIALRDQMFSMSKNVNHLMNMCSIDFIQDYEDKKYIDAAYTYAYDVSDYGKIFWNFPSEEKICEKKAYDKLIKPTNYIPAGIIPKQDLKDFISYFPGSILHNDLKNIIEANYPNELNNFGKYYWLNGNLDKEGRRAFYVPRISVPIITIKNSPYHDGFDDNIMLTKIDLFDNNFVYFNLNLASSGKIIYIDIKKEDLNKLYYHHEDLQAILLNCGKGSLFSEGLDFLGFKKWNDLYNTGLKAISLLNEKAPVTLIAEREALKKVLTQKFGDSFGEKTASCILEDLVDSAFSKF
jgi:hypothetical protein